MLRSVWPNCISDKSCGLLNRRWSASSYPPEPSAAISHHPAFGERLRLAQSVCRVDNSCCCKLRDGRRKLSSQWVSAFQFPARHHRVVCLSHYIERRAVKLSVVPERHRASIE